MKHIAILTLHSSLFILHSSAALPQRWDVKLEAQPPQIFSLQRPRGETYELEAVLKDHGKPFAPAITNAFIYWQTNGMANLYWSAPASVSNNVLRATWLPSMDPGASTVLGYIGDSGHIYAAAFQFRFIASPGATPNELPLPQKVIDFAKVTVLNPPWSGGGSGVDTNAVRDIVRKTVDGAAKMLPKYLWCMDFDDSYPDDAAWYYAQPQDYGSCSAVRYGGSLFRNYDWRFDGMAEFVVRMSAGPGRFASVGVANCGTNLTEEIVASGKPSRYFKCLPGRTVDGVNENGVCAEVNVVGGYPGDRWDNPDGDIHPLAAVRWALDNATSAGMAASNLASRIAFPPEWSQNFHWMLADSAQTWIVEDGACSNVTGRAVMTNFELYPTPVFGPGWERYVALTNGVNITNVWFTNAYSIDADWLSEFSDLDEMNQAKIAWNNGKGKESHRGQHYGDNWWWQTVHTSVYDLTNRTLRICVQEQDDWYVFQVPPPGGGSCGTNTNDVKAIVDAEVGGTNDVKAAVAAIQPLKSSVTSLSSSVSALASSKRDKTDIDVTEPKNVHWVWTSDDPECPAGWLNIANSFGANKPTYSEEHYWYVHEIGGASGDTMGSPPPDSLTVTFSWIKNFPEEGYVNFLATATRASATDTTPVNVDKIALASKLAVKVDKEAGKSLSSNDYTAGEKAEVAKVKDKADEFTAWVYDKPNVEIEYLQNLGWHPKVGGVFNGDENSLELHWSSDQSYYNIDFTATRKRVLRTGDAATPQDLQDEISPTNTTFSNAVVTVARELTPPALPYMRQYDSVLHCWWIGRMVNGVIEWEVE